MLVKTFLNPSYQIYNFYLSCIAIDIKLKIPHILTNIHNSETYIPETYNPD